MTSTPSIQSSICVFKGKEREWRCKRVKIILSLNNSVHIDRDIIVIAFACVYT